MIRFTHSSRGAEFEHQIMPHFDAAFSLARFLMRNDQDAEDVTQEACLRAFRFYESFRGGNSRAWFLSIVRNTAFSALKRSRSHESDVPFDEELHTIDLSATNAGEELDRQFDQQTVRRAIEELATEFREAITLRELENCSYKEIAEIAGVPIGTVMSRLARARVHLRAILARTLPEETKP